MPLMHTLPRHPPCHAASVPWLPKRCCGRGGPGPPSPTRCTCCFWLVRPRQGQILRRPGRMGIHPHMHWHPRTSAHVCLAEPASPPPSPPPSPVQVRAVVARLSSDPVVAGVSESMSEEIGPGIYRFKAEVAWDGERLVERYLQR